MSRVCTTFSTGGPEKPKHTKTHTQDTRELVGTKQNVSVLW